MAGSIGQVYYDVVPNLDGFGAKVAAGLSRQKPVKIKVEADTQAAEASAKKLTGVQVKEAQLSSRQRMALMQRDAIAENRYRDRAAASAKRASAQRLALMQRDAIAENRYRDRAVAAQERAAARLVAAEQKAAAQQKAARASAVQKGGTGLLVGGAAALYALKQVTDVTMDFDKAVSNVAATGAEASASIGQLRQEAIKYGADTAFSATEAANAQAELIKANVSVTDTINGGLKGALDLAAAGSLDVAQAAGIMGTAMSQFKLPGTDASHVADLLAAAAGKAQGEVTDFAEALEYVGPLAKSSGVSLEQTTGVLAEFANQGILGSKAGTALRGIFLGLTAPVGAGAKAIEKYGINVRDAQGNFIGLEGAAGELQKRLGGLSRAQRDAALAAIFGRNQVTAATILYEEGAKGVADMTKNVNDLDYASRTAATKMDNLAGDVEQLKGALDSAFIQSGGGGTAFLRDLAQGATEAIDGFNALSPATQKGAFQFAAIAAAGALATGAFIKIVGVAQAANAALLTTGIVGPKAAAGLSAVGTAAAAAGIGLAAVAAGNAVFDALGAKTKTADQLATSLEEIAKGGGDLNSVFSKSNFFDQIQGGLTTGIAPANNLASAFKGLAISQDTFLGKVSLWREKITPGTQSIQQAQDQVGALDDALSAMVAGGKGDQAAAAVERLGISAQDQNRFLPQYAAGLKTAGDTAASSFRQSEIAFRNAGTGLDTTGEAAGRTAEELQAVTTEMYAAASAALGLSGNSIAVEAAMDAAAQAVKDNGKNLDISTAKGRANQQALDNLAASTLTATSAMQEQGKSASSIAAVNERAKASWIKNAVAMGKNSDKAKELADELFALPAEVTSEVVVSGAKVSRKEARDLNAALKGIPKEQRARIVTIANTKGAKAAQVEIAKVKNKSVIAKATGKGVNTVREIDAAIKKLKSKAVRAQANAAGKAGVKALDDAIKALKSRRVQASATTSGKGAVDGLRSSIARLSDKTVTVTVRRKGQPTMTSADGNYIPPVRRAGGGPIRGWGGPRDDNIMGIDRATGIQTSWVSSKEFVTNALSYANNAGAVETINAYPNKKFDLIERLANGGSPSKRQLVGTTAAGSRSITLNLDLGPIFGGVQRMVLDLADDRDEYTATVGRMGR